MSPWHSDPPYIFVQEPVTVLAGVDHKTACGICGQAINIMVLARCAASEHAEWLKGRTQLQNGQGTLLED